MLIPKNSKEYVRFAIYILQQFGITLTKQQKQELYALPTEVAVDRYKMNLIFKEVK